MKHLQRNIAITSKRTGRVVRLDMTISRSWGGPNEFQEFLIRLYMKDFSVYQTYSQLLFLYLTKNPDNLPAIEIMENLTVLSTIQVMFMVRDMDDKAQENLEHQEMQEFIQSLSQHK